MSEIHVELLKRIRKSMVENETQFLCIALCNHVRDHIEHAAAEDIREAMCPIMSGMFEEGSTGRKLWKDWGLYALMPRSFVYKAYFGGTGRYRRISGTQRRVVGEIRLQFIDALIEDFSNV